MRCTMKKAFHFGLAILFALSVLITSSTAAETDSTDISPQGITASEQLSSYYASLSNISSGTMSVAFTVTGTHNNMTKIGAQKIVIEREATSGKWQTYYTFTGYYGYNRLSYGSTIDFDVMPGQNYRATLTAYASDSVGSDTGSVTSGILRAL